MYTYYPTSSETESHRRPWAEGVRDAVAGVCSRPAARGGDRYAVSHQRGLSYCRSGAPPRGTSSPRLLEFLTPIGRDDCQTDRLLLDD
ncbi:hypothetical protein JTB14_028612 [Gonioctena quinquepunctata]|nr:hypothetical protein JTB14_028612 [Gonioctena quinquepunctata]